MTLKLKNTYWFLLNLVVRVCATAEHSCCDLFPILRLHYLWAALCRSPSPSIRCSSDCYSDILKVKSWNDQLIFSKLGCERFHSCSATIANSKWNQTLYSCPAYLMTLVRAWTPPSTGPSKNRESFSYLANFFSQTSSWTWKFLLFNGCNWS